MRMKRLRSAEPARPASRPLMQWLVLAAIGAGAACAGPHAASAAALFAPAFNGPALDAGLTEDGTAGTAYSVSAGSLVLSQAAGNPDGSVTVTAMAPLAGDFSARVTLSGTALGLADAGLIVMSADSGAWLSDAFMNGRSGTVNANIFIPPNGTFLPAVSSTATLTISRIGDTITDIVDTGAGILSLNSGTDPALGGPVNIGLFLLEAAGDTSADQARFTNFSVFPIPEPGAIGFLAEGALLLACVRSLARRRRPAGAAASC